MAFQPTSFGSRQARPNGMLGYDLQNTLTGNTVEQQNKITQANNLAQFDAQERLLAAQGVKTNPARRVGYEAGSAFFKPFADKFFPSDDLKNAQANEKIQLEMNELITDDMTQTERLTVMGNHLMKSGNPQQGFKMLQLASSIKDGNAPLSSAGKAAYDLGLAKGTPEYTKFVQEYALKTDAPTIQGVRVKAYGKKYEDTLKNSDEASIKIKKLDMMYSLVNDPKFGAETGFGKYISKNYAPILSDLGFKEYTDEATFNQSFDAVKEGLLADILNLATGPQTDSDAQRARKALAGLGNTPAANKFIVGFSLGINKAQIEKQEFIDDWLDENDSSGGDMKGAFQAYKKFEKGKPTAIDFYKPKGAAVPTFYWEYEARILEQNPNQTKESIQKSWTSAKKSAFSGLKPSSKTAK